MSENKLKPCPFCGVKPEEPKSWDDGVLWCNNPKCAIMPEVQDLCATRQSAIAAWNTRVPDPQRQRLVDALKLAQPILSEELQCLCESFCPPCAEGELYDYSKLSDAERELVTKTEAALDAIDAVLKEVAE